MTDGCQRHAPNQGYFFFFFFLENWGDEQEEKDFLSNNKEVDFVPRVWILRCFNNEDYLDL